jgi:hypothetical protein
MSLFINSLSWRNRMKTLRSISFSVLALSVLVSANASAFDFSFKSLRETYNAKAYDVKNAFNNVWASMPSQAEAKAAMGNAASAVVAPVKAHPVITGVVAAAVVTTVAGYTAYAKGYFGKVKNYFTSKK